MLCPCHVYPDCRPSSHFSLFSSSYARLRTYLTSKLLPRRENLLQIRRQLVNSDNEVDTTRVNIERETLADVDKILERLRNVASLRHSSIQNQVPACATLLSATLLPPSRVTWLRKQVIILKY